MANDKKNPYGSGAAETREPQGGTNSGIGKQPDGSDRTNPLDQGAGRNSALTPEADRARTGVLDGAGSRDGATGGNPDGMRKNSAGDANSGVPGTGAKRDNRNDGGSSGQREVPQVSAIDGAEGTEGSVNDRGTDRDEAIDGNASRNDRGSDTAGGM